MIKVKVEITQKLHGSDDIGDHLVIIHYVPSKFV